MGVVVTSDEELQVALTTLTGPVYKLKVKLGDKAKEGGHPGMAGSAQVHWGVVCDGCDGLVVGPRHKCLVCPDYDLCATCEAQGLHAHHKMIRLPAPCKRVAPRCHLARQVNPILGDPNIQVLANLFGGRPWVSGCQGMRPATPATENQAEPKNTKPAEKKPETEKIAEAKKTECGEPSKPATATEADYTTDQTSANANGLPGILADLTPLLGPMQAEQLAQFLRNISAQNQEPEKKEAKEKQPEQQLQEQLGQFGQLGQLGQLGGLISTFLGPAAVEAAFPLLEALTKAGQDHLAKDGQDGQEQSRKGDNQATEEQVPAQEKEAEEKEKKDVVPEKEKEKNMETQDDIKEDSDFEVIPEVSQKTSIYPTLPTEEQTRLWKTNPRQPEDKNGKETAEKMDSNAHTNSEDM